MKKLCSVMLVLIASAGISQAAITDLTSATQGEGNKGMAWVPIGSQGFEITARSSVDENDPFSYYATGSTGTGFASASTVPCFSEKTLRPDQLKYGGSGTGFGPTDSEKTLHPDQLKFPHLADSVVLAKFKRAP